MDRRSGWLLALSAFVACIWLNQSVGGKDWEDLRDRVFAAPASNPVQFARYPFVFLYRRSADERLYYEAAGAMLGAPYDEDVLRTMRGRLPPSFDVPLPPVDGKWHAPFREVPMEYPPLLLPFVLVPRALVSSFEGFGYVFGTLMGLCLVLAIALGLDAARRAGEDAPGMRRRAWMATALLLAQGALAIQRLDAVSTLALALGVHAAVRRRPGQVGFWFGLAGATKIVPILALPAVLAADPSLYRDRAAQLRLAAGTAVALALGFVPMILLSPHALPDMLGYHAARGLHCESTLGVLITLGRLALGAGAAATPSFGSMNLEGALPDVLAKVSGPLMLAGALFVAVRAYRAPVHGPSRVALVTVTALAALWLTGKVLSPQYFTWAIPLVLAIPGKEGMRLAWALVVAMAVTQLYLRGYYDLVAEGAWLGVLSVAVRQGILAVASARAVCAIRAGGAQDGGALSG